MPSPGIELGSSRLPVSAILDFRFGLVLARFDLGPRNKVPRTIPLAKNKVWKKKGMYSLGLERVEGSRKRVYCSVSENRVFVF